MTNRESLQAMIQGAIARTRDRSVKAFEREWAFTVTVALKGRSVGQFDAMARAWLHENCSGRFYLRSDIEAAGFVDEDDAVAFALRFSA